MIRPTRVQRSARIGRRPPSRSGPMRKFLPILVSATAFIILAAIAYHLASPKIVLTNRSHSHHDELIVTLPSSRVSFGPIAPGTTDTIYFSRQSTGGTVTYSLRTRGKELARGTLAYDGSGQFFRTLAVVIHEDGNVSSSLSDWPGT